jgi:hypothetical protein
VFFAAIFLRNEPETQRVMAHTLRDSRARRRDALVWWCLRASVSAAFVFVPLLSVWDARVM